MPTVNARSIQQITTDRAVAEATLIKAEENANALRVEHAAATLREVFPQHTLAVFGRTWDEDAPRLMQLLSSEEGVVDIDLDDDASAESLTREQSKACALADTVAKLIRGDIEMSQCLASDIKVHADWVEFNLALKD